MATLKEYLNSKIKSKGSSLAKEKAKAKDYKSISAAKKDNALYYTNKAGKVMAAVFAEDLKSSPTKAEPKTSVLAPAKSERPKTKAEVKSRAASTSSRKTILTSGQKPKKLTTVKPKSSNTIAKRAQSEVRIKTAGPKKAMSLAERTKIAANKRALAANNKKIVEGSSANKSRKPKKLTGAAWMKTHTFADYMALTKSEARALGLPATRVAATQHRLRNIKFKDGKGFFRK